MNADRAKFHITKRPAFAGEPAPQTVLHAMTAMAMSGRVRSDEGDGAGGRHPSGQGRALRKAAPRSKQNQSPKREQRKII